MPKLQITEGPDQGREFVLDELGDGSHIAGRDPRHPIAIADTTVSREHFRLERLGRRFRLVDLGSRNRTFVNGEPISDSLLHAGDVIAVGDSELRYEDDREEVELADLSSTIIKEYSSLERNSIERIIDSLKTDPNIRKDRIERAVANLRQLFDLSREMMQSASVDDLYRKFLEILVPAVEADRGVVMVNDGDRWSPRAVFNTLSDPMLNQSTKSRNAENDEDTHTEGAPRDRDPAILVSETIIRQVAEERKAILSRDAGSDARFEDGNSIAEAAIKSVIAAPISSPVTGDGVFAVLYADRRSSKEPFGEDELHLLSAAAEQAGGVVHSIESTSNLRQENRNLIRSLSESRPIIGNSAAVDEIHAFVRKAAPTAMTVLIRGETGTGKDLVASAIHYHSPRKGKPFVAINCAALPENLIEAELFGYEKGAFTGAMSRKKGRFELAHPGTIFLDEIAELSLGCQAKLLRLLEERRFERVGGTQQIEVDVRIVAATNKDLSTAIEEGTFREDLFYRLNVLTLSLAPLRQRPEDVGTLVRYFLNEMGYGDDKKILSSPAERKLLEYAWPGNIRQLRNVVESAVVLKEGPTIQPEDLVLSEARPRSGEPDEWTPEALDEVHRKHILRVLEHTGGNKKRAAEILGIERCTLYSKLKSYGVGAKGSSATES